MSGVPARILAIDPGPERSAWLHFDARTGGLTHPTNLGIWPNHEVVDFLRPIAGYCDAVVIEQVASYGMPVGAEVFETVFWSGRFAEACRNVPVHRIPRLTVKLHLCHSPKANDATIRAALIDRFGGKDKAIGRKATPGPLYGIHADLWAALALAVTFADQTER